MNDYERVASVIRYLDRHYTEQPDLNALAQSIDLSPFHFHRLFSNWAGVTPKDFLQSLTFEHVKTLLPRGGAGLRIDYGVAESPFGSALIAETPRGICHLSFLNGQGRKGARDLLAAEWPKAQLLRADDRAHEVANQIFVHSAQDQPGAHLRAFVRGTPFQLRVWRALLRVPTGALTTYGRLAVAIHQPTAARAVGSAVGANPLAFIIPCHRVIRETGALGNYHWDPIRKRAILGWELARVGAMREHATA